VLGWRVVESRDDVVLLELRSPLMNARVVGRFTLPARTSVTTFVTYVRPRPARRIWAATSVLHRLFAPYLLNRASADAYLPAASRSRVQVESS
jgi:hypothetical protein